MAQLGSAPALGAGGRRFESGRPDKMPEPSGRGRGPGPSNTLSGRCRPLMQAVERQSVSDRYMGEVGDVRSSCSG